MNRPQSTVALEKSDLNDLDRQILDVLKEGRASPMLALRILEDRQNLDVTRQYVGSRMVRLAEHGHLENLYDTGIYEIRDDPRLTQPGE